MSDSRAEACETIAITWRGQRHEAPWQAGETILAAAQRFGFSPRFACLAGNCAACAARVTEGRADMAVNRTLTDGEVAQGYVLTCQARPASRRIAVDYME